ncbi:MAG: hypothetical protein ACHRXM_28115 [Isosphaerales bacterium]
MVISSRTAEGWVEMSGQNIPKPGHRRRFRMSILVLMVLVLISGCVFGWVEHRIRLRAAQAAYQHAKITREVAQIAVVEYIEGIYKQDIETVQGEISLAEADLKRAQERLDRSKRMAEKRNVPGAATVSAEQAVERANFVLEQVRKKRMTLEEKTKVHAIGELKSEIEKAKADELTGKVAYEKTKATWMGLLW